MAALMTLVAVAACGDDSTGPENQIFDPELALQNYDAVGVVLDSEPFQNFQNIGVVFGGQVSSPTEMFDLIRGQGSPNRVMAAHQTVISAENRGNTFVFDTTEMNYVVDGERTGAPENGVRFLIYTEDGAGNPDVTDERGYVDLIDLGNDTTDNVELRLEAVYDSLQFLEYQLDLLNDEVTGVSTLEVDGFLSDGIDRLDFEADVSSSVDDSTQVTSTSIDYRLRIDARNFEVNAALTLDLDEQENENSSIDMSVQHGTDVLRLQAAGDDAMIDGSISVDGTVFALVTGDPDNPTVTKADGSAMTVSEIQALSRMISFVGELFELFGDLLTPVTAIVFLGFVL